MAGFAILSYAESRWPSLYVPLYTAKAAAVTLLAVACRAAWRDVRLSARVLVPAILVGFAVFAEWVLVDRWMPFARYGGGRAAFDPFTQIANPAERAAFLVVRFYGLVLLVPVIEELFWRSFLLRYITRPDWQTVVQGTYSGTAFVLVAAAFAAAHPEWLAAMICAAAYALLLRQTRSLFACVVAHATTNLALGIYILATASWQYW